MRLFGGSEWLVALGTTHYWVHDALKSVNRPIDDVAQACMCVSCVMCCVRVLTDCALCVMCCVSVWLVRMNGNRVWCMSTPCVVVVNL